MELDEDEITSDSEDDEWDPYAASAAWSHAYESSLDMDSIKHCEGQSLGNWGFDLVVTSHRRKGVFRRKAGPVPNKFSVRFARGTLLITVPLAAGGCNQGTKGPTNVTLVKLPAHA